MSNFSQTLVNHDENIFPVTCNHLIYKHPQKSLITILEDSISNQYTYQVPQIIIDLQYFTVFLTNVITNEQNVKKYTEKYSKTVILKTFIFLLNNNLLSKCPAWSI